MGHADYPLLEFASRLASVEEKYAREIQSLVECFCCSRLDLPVKKLEELTRVRLKTARHLKKIDEKKGELVALWKICNVYSATAVDVDEAMRDIRGSLRKRLKPIQRDSSAFKRFVDEYRPANKRTEAPQEIYDMNRPNLKEKQRFLDLFKKKDSRKFALQDAEQSYTQHLVDNVKASVRQERKNVLPPPPPQIISITTPPPVPPKPEIEKSEEKGMKKEYSLTMRKEEAKTLTEQRKSAPAVDTSTKPQLPPVAPPRKTLPRAQSTTNCSDVTAVNSKKPAQTSSSHVEKPYPKQITTVPPTVIQLEYQQTNRSSDNRTTIKMEDPSTVPPSPQLTIRVSDEEPPVIPASRITNGRIYKYHTQQQPARPVLQAQFISVGGDDEENVIDRL